MKKLFIMPLMLLALYSMQSFAEFGPSFNSGFGSYNSMGSMNGAYNSYGGYSNFGEMQSLNGGTGDNVTCACARKVSQGDSSDPVCNQRVKELVNVAIQRNQMNAGSMGSLLNSGAAVHAPGTLGTP